MARRKLTKTDSASAGFTLIELLLIMAILALTISVVMMNAPSGRSPAQKDAERFAAMMLLATQEAILSGAPMRLEITPVEYRYRQYLDGEWTAAAVDWPLEASFTPRTNIEVELGDAVFANAAELSGVDDDERDSYIVMIDPAGAATPLNMRFSDRRGAWTVNMSAEGEVRMARDGA